MSYRTSNHTKPVGRDKLTRIFLVLSTLSTMVITYGVFYSPFIASVYLPALVATYLTLWAANFYAFGWWKLKNWYNERLSAAKKRLEEKERIKEELDKRRQAGLL